MRTKALITLCAFVAVCALTTAPATAALKKYDMQLVALLQFIAASPEVERELGSGNPSLSVIDESAADPVLRKFLIISQNAQTVVLPDLSGGFVFFTVKQLDGPSNNQTGTGSTASSITWGNLSGWTITGGSWCHSVPSYICLLGPGGVGDDTVDPILESTHFDVGTWTFHGTGFRATPYVAFTTDTAGNSLHIWRGALAQDGTVPALPLVGVGAVGASLIAMGWSALRRRS